MSEHLSGEAHQLLMFLKRKGSAPYVRTPRTTELLSKGLAIVNLEERRLLISKNGEMAPRKRRAGSG